MVKQFEVEQKFRVAAPAELLAALAGRGVTLGDAELQVDCYYAHPQRDFAATDEALRIRRIDERNFVTYKGPKLDRTTKTRREIDVAFAPGEAAGAQLADLLAALSFQPVTEVRKRRRSGHLPWQGFDVIVTLDDVEQVGLYAELEVVADEAQLDRARACLASLSAELRLDGGERRSYLELLLANRSATSGTR